MSERSIVVHPDAATLADAVAARLLTRLLDLQSSHSPLHIVVTGGTVGISSLAAVAHSSLIHAVDWSQVHFWWGDERYLPQDDPERNEVQARAALLDALVADSALTASHIHAMPPRQGADSPAQAAQSYARELRDFAPVGHDLPLFDILMLGVGPDGHVASLFPGHPELAAGGTTAGVRNSPKPPPDRVTLTFEAIRSAREVWLVAAGGEKASAVAAALAGAPVFETPAAGVQGRERTLWLLDVAAAGLAGTPA